MQRSLFAGLAVVVLLAGCGPQAPAPRQVAVPPDDASNGPSQVFGNPVPDHVVPVTPIVGPAAALDSDKQDRYTNSLLDALNLLAQKKQEQALAALEAAKAIQNNDQVQQEIDRLKEGMARQAATEATVQNIRTVLDDGLPEEASRLATQALAQYGGSDAADDLLKLKREADALLAARAGAGDSRKQARADADAALEAKNLRAAAAALEQALQQGDDADLKKQLDDVHDRLARYDDNRRRAEELRRDPSSLEDAVAALQEAQKAWDTFEVQQQLAEYTLALQNRRDRLGVADFEVRGDVGLADAGRTLADELLPAFKSRYDLVERGQIGQVVGELKLEARDLDDGHNRSELGRLAKLRYLVVGSVSRLGGLSVNARLVDVRSGLVVQTARATAATPEDLLPLLPQLANELMMTDNQKMAYEGQLAKQAAAPPQAAEPEALPPPPEVTPDDQAPPPPVVTETPLAPPPGEIRPEDFQALPPPPLPDQAAVAVEDRPDAAVKLRLRHVCIELGDNLFRRGRFHEAHAQFELALNLGGDRPDIEVRIDRCQPHLPPPPPPELIVVAPPRPRIAILDLAVIGDPDVVPPALGPWTADNLAPYFCPPYDVVDRETVCWYMNRLGLSLRDVLTDPVARRWLGRALGVRFFVLGDVRQTASFVVTTHLVDAECGYQYGWGSIHVHDFFELRLRLGELAGQTLLDPVERKRRQDEAEAAERERKRMAEMAEADRLRALQESQNVPLLVLEAQKIGDGGNLSVSLELLGRARKLRPDDVEINVLFGRFNDRRRRDDWQDERKRDWDRQQAQRAADQEQQAALARAAEEARARAAQDAAARQAADSQALERQRQQAFLQLQAQAQLASQQQQFNQAVQLYQSALALRQTDDAFRGLAEARARADEAAKLAAAQAAEQQQAALRQQREAELAQARQQLAEQRRSQEAKEQAERAAQAARDQAAYQRLLDDAERQLAKEQYDAAISALQTARQLRRTDEVDRLLTQALTEQTRATALKNNPDRDELERRLKEETARREKAEAEAAHNRELYETALKQAADALARKNYDVAEAKYQDAGKVYNTDVVLTSLKKVRAARADDAAAAAAEKAKRDAEAKKDADFQRLSEKGAAALEQKHYDEAVLSFTAANGIKPGDVGVLTGLAKAQQGQADAAARAKRDADAAQQEAAFRQFLDGGKANLAANKYDAAAVALKEAVRLRPADAEAAAALQQAVKGQAEAVKTDEQLAQTKKNADAYQKAMADGRATLAAKQYDAAVNAFTEAQKLQPGDAGSAEFLKQARKAKADADATTVAAAKQHDEEQQRVAAVQKALAQGRAALAARDLDTAGKAFAAAADKAPGDPDVKKIQLDLQTALNAAKAEADAKKKRGEQVQALVKKGTDAQAAGRYDEAVQALAQASQLAPDDAATRDLLAKAQKARMDFTAAADQAAAKKVAAERAAKVTGMVADVRKALAGQDYAGAGKLLADARKLAPDDAGVAKAQDDLAAASKETADRLKKQQADYALAMDAGKAAARKGNYEGAINSYTEAMRILPGDRDAAAALKDAQGAKAKADIDAKKKADEARVDAERKKRDAEYAAAMKSGRDALAAKKYEDAAKAFTDAGKIAPGDKDAAAGLKSAQDGAAADAKKKMEEARRREDFNKFMAQGQAMLAANRPADAVKSFGDAARLDPADPAAAKALHDATQAVQAMQAAQAKADADKKQRDALYAAAMKSAHDALAAKKYDDAAKAFADAGKIVPGDKDAAAGLKSAQDGATAAAAKMAEEAKRKADFANFLAQGQAAQTAKKYDDAAKAYQSALTLQPGDAKATAGLQSAQFSQHMAAGAALGAAKKFPDAVKEYQAALAIFPDNADAKAALKRAQGNMP